MFCVSRERREEKSTRGSASFMIDKNLVYFGLGFSGVVLLLTQLTVLSNTSYILVYSLAAIIYVIETGANPRAFM